MTTTQHLEPATTVAPPNGQDIDDVLFKARAPRGMSDCRKKLRWLISNPPENLAMPMTITPNMAAAMMERNANDEWRNRPHSERGQRRYVRAMRSGWKYTGETIIFSASGRLLNGQHRLNACVESGVAFPCLVAFGVDDDAFKFMDIGIARTAGHIFAIEGIPNYNYAASVARIVHAYDSSTSWNGLPAAYVENDELLEFFWRHEGIQDSYKVARLFGSGRPSLMPNRWAGALHYICARKSRPSAEEFFEKVGTGVGILSKSDPAHLLRKKLLENAGTNPGDKESDLYMAAYVVQAWNAFRRNEKRQIFRWRGGQNPNEPFPRAV